MAKVHSLVGKRLAEESSSPLLAADSPSPEGTGTDPNPATTSAVVMLHLLTRRKQTLTSIKPNIQLFTTATVA